VPIFYIDNNKTNSMIQKDIQKLLFLKLVQVAVDKDDNLIVRLTCAKNAEDTSGFVLNITSTVSKAKNNNLANQEQLPQDNNKGVCEHAKNRVYRGNESNGQEEENNKQP
jgi:GTPase SAR1 family protein